MKPAEAGFFPLDRQLALWETHWSEQVAKHAVRLAGLMQFEEAAGILSDMAHTPMSDSTVWRRAQKWGAQFKAREDAQRAEANAAPARGVPVAGDARGTQRMGIAMDGVKIPIRHETEKWRELKVACVFDIELRPTRDKSTGDLIDQAHAVHNSYAAYLGGPEVFGQLAWMEAWRRRWPQAADTLALCDGAPWLWNLTKEHFFDSRQAVDWYHATEHLGNVAKLLHGDGTPEMRRWYKDRETLLMQGHAARLADELLQAAKSKSRVAADLRREAGYFDTNQHRMQYLELREDGFPIGSGMVESAGKQYRARFCGPGMSWSRAGAERLIPVRSALMSKRFDEVWGAVYKLPLN